MAKNLRACFLLFALTLLICSVLYPAFLLALGQAVFPSAANGSLVTRPDGTNIGSTLIAQAFTKDEYFWPRPSAASCNAAAAGGSNWGAAQPKLRDRVAQQLGPLVRYRPDGPRKGAPVGPDIEKWFAAEPDRVAKWAEVYPTSAAGWVKNDMTGDKYGPNGVFVAAWAKTHPEAVAAWKKANADKNDDPKPEDLVGPFFDDFAKSHPGTFPIQVDVKAADGSIQKRVRPAKSGSTIQAAFFDQWLQDPAIKEKAADIEPVPADFVTASGGGLDPHITERNARWQLDRIVAKRSMSAEDASRLRPHIERLINQMSSSPLAGLAGEPLVNVLELNLELDRRFPVPPTS
jgi:K+-transporting ATPase ATPase C chain